MEAAHAIDYTILGLSIGLLIGLVLGNYARKATLSLEFERGRLQGLNDGWRVLTALADAARAKAAESEKAGS